MRFTKRDEATKLVDLIRAEQQQLAGLEKKFEAIRPKWHAAQRACSELQSLVDAKPLTYRRRATCDELFIDHDALIEQELAAAIARRDQLSADLPSQIQATKDRIFSRMSRLSGALGSFIAGVIGHGLSGSDRPQCGEQLQQELLAARKQAEQLEDPQALLELVERVVERIEDADLQSVPLLKLDKVIGQALEVV